MQTDTPDATPEQEPRSPRRRCAGCNKLSWPKPTDAHIWPDGRARHLCSACRRTLRYWALPRLDVPVECLT
jgi:hypothetical protein